MFNIKIYLALLMLVLTIACSPTDGGSGHVEISDLVGLWNSSENFGSQKDVMYTRISSNGDIIEYDFDGDEVDQGLNCYLINSGSLKHIDANHFLVTADMHENKQFEVELELLDNGHVLKIYFLDSNDLDGDNNRTETLKSQIWTRMKNDEILLMEPSCKKAVSFLVQMS